MKITPVPSVEAVGTLTTIAPELFLGTYDEWLGSRGNPEFGPMERENVSRK